MNLVPPLLPLTSASLSSLSQPLSQPKTAQDGLDVPTYSNDFNMCQQQNLQPPQFPSYCGIGDYNTPASPYLWLGGHGMSNSPCSLQGNGTIPVPQRQFLSGASGFPMTGWFSQNDTLKMRPPYSYASLVAMAIQCSPEKKCTLSQIYEFVLTNFDYYKKDKAGWQNSIRHNLSLNACFKKISRKDNDPGKGHYWIVDPNCEKDFDNGNFRRKRKPSKMKGRDEQTSSSEKGKEDLSLEILPPLMTDTSSQDITNISPPAATYTPCLSNFYSSMSSLDSGYPNGQMPLSLVAEVTQRNITGLSNLTASSVVESPGPVQDGGQFYNRTPYYTSFSATSQSQTMNPQFIHSFQTPQPLLYPGRY